MSENNDIGMLLLPYPRRPYLAIGSSHHLVSTYHILQSTTDNVTKLVSSSTNNSFIISSSFFKKHLYPLLTRQKKKKFTILPFNAFHTHFSTMRLGHAENIIQTQSET